MQLSGFGGLFANSHVLGQGGSRNYRIGDGGGGPILTDVHVILYLLNTVFQLTIPRELKFPWREGGVQVFRRSGGQGRDGVWRS